MTTPVQLYIDTNVLLDAIDRRRSNPNSTHLLEQLRARGELSSIVSIFVLMEAVEQRQQSAHISWLVNSGYTYSEIQSEGGRNRSLSEVECGRCFDEVLGFRRALGKKMKVVSPASDTVWKDAADLVRTTNIGASDALHVAIAHSAGSHVFATSDRSLVRELSRLRLRPRLIPLNCNRERKSVEFQRDFERAVHRVRSSKPITVSRADAKALKDSVESIKEFFRGSSPTQSKQ